MGASNVKHAYQHYAGLVPPASMLLLLYMAVTSRDNDPAPEFWGGAETLAQALGRDDRKPFDDHDRRAVGRRITPLIATGAITIAHRPRPGRPTVYRLHLRPPTQDTS